MGGLLVSFVFWLMATGKFNDYLMLALSGTATRDNIGQQKETAKSSYISDLKSIVDSGADIYKMYFVK